MRYPLHLVKVQCITSLCNQHITIHPHHSLSFLCGRKAASPQASGITCNCKLFSSFSQTAAHQSYIIRELTVTYHAMPPPLYQPVPCVTDESTISYISTFTTVFFSVIIFLVSPKISSHQPEFAPGPFLRSRILQRLEGTNYSQEQSIFPFGQPVMRISAPLLFSVPACNGSLQPSCPGHLSGVSVRKRRVSAMLYCTAVVPVYGQLSAQLYGLAPVCYKHYICNFRAKGPLHVSESKQSHSAYFR